MTTQPVSVTQPVSQAFDHVKRVLFQPFDIGKWFVIGFCAWLAFLGEGGGGGGGGGNFNPPSSGHGDRSFRHQFDQARDYVIENLYWIIPVAAALILLCFVMWVVFTWLSSRGRFMFLHCVALNKAEVVEPWNRFSRAGNSLFGFRIVLGLVGLVVILTPLALAIIQGFRMGLNDAWTVAGILSLVVLVLFMIAMAVVLGIIGKFTTDFVVPIMFVSGGRCLQCWGTLRKLLAENVGRFILYLLFQIVLGIVIGMLVLTVVLVTCCIAGCLMAIPYLGTVLLLPVLVFQRSYSIFYLAQYGREYNVFVPPTTPAAPGTAS